MTILWLRISILESENGGLVRTLQLIRRHPGRRAKELSLQLKEETPKLKLRVRKLKNLGLTISLGICPKCCTQAVEVLEIKNPRSGLRDSEHNRNYPTDSMVGFLIMKCRAYQHQYQEYGYLTLHSGMFRRSKIPKRE